jgi:hypothetical protein
MIRASVSALSSTRRPSCWIARPRTGAGTRRPVALGVPSRGAGLDEGRGVGQAHRCDDLVEPGGVRDVLRAAGASSRVRPAIDEETVRAIEPS